MATPEELKEIQEAISEFVVCFELVFDKDWDMTKNQILNDLYIKENGTFINPNVEDESNNWMNRGSLLASYRHLLKVMKKYNISNSID